MKIRVTETYCRNFTVAGQMCPAILKPFIIILHSSKV